MYVIPRVYNNRSQSLNLRSKNDAMRIASIMTGSLYLVSKSVHIVSFICMANAVSRVLSTVSFFFRCFERRMPCWCSYLFFTTKPSVRYDNGLKYQKQFLRRTAQYFLSFCVNLICLLLEQHLKLVAVIAYRWYFQMLIPNKLLCLH